MDSLVYEFILKSYEDNLNWKAVIGILFRRENRQGYKEVPLRGLSTLKVEVLQLNRQKLCKPFFQLYCFTTSQRVSHHMQLKLIQKFNFLVVSWAHTHTHTHTHTHSHTPQPLVTSLALGSLHVRRKGTLCISNMPSSMYPKSITQSMLMRWLVCTRHWSGTWKDTSVKKTKIIVIIKHIFLGNKELVGW
jgi:hypothetical protein